MLTLHGINKDAWNQYREDGSWYYEVVECGFKYNLSDLQSAVGIHQLRKLENFTERRTLYAQMFNEAFRDMDEIEIPAQAHNGRHAWHLYPLRLNLSEMNIDRARFIAELRRKNVGASVHFIPVQLHPFFKKWADLPQNQCPRSLELYPRLVSLPLYPAMTEEEVNYVIRAVKDIVAAHRAEAVTSAPWDGGQAQGLMREGVS
jgi:dTDP-4-amino-4,6-dideoxygalactose transaminase